MDYLKENYPKILTVIIMVVLIFATYYLFTPHEVSVREDIASANRAEVQRTVNMLRDLKKIKLDKEVFASDAFVSLRDNDVQLPPYELGKANPFFPIATSTPERLVETVPQPIRSSQDTDDGPIPVIPLF
jgi:hypothetical protein